MKDKTAVAAFGRMNPPTAGHALLVNKVHEVAREHGGDAHIRLSHSQDSKKNPLSASQKLKHAKGLFPHANLSASSKESPSYLTHAAELHKKGYKHLVMVAGEDRVKQYHDTLHKYNGKFDEHGNGFHFKSIKVVSAGHRDPDAEGTTGISASKMRQHAHNNDYKSFHAGLPVGTSHTHGKAIFNDVRNGMKLHEDADRDAYVKGLIFNRGDLVEDLTTGQICPVEFRGDNYVTILTTEGDIVKRFIKDITMAEKDLHEDHYLNRWAKEKAATNRKTMAADKPLAPRKPIFDRVREKADPINHEKMARDIEHAWGNAFPDGDPYDHISRRYPHLHRAGTLGKHLNTAAKKHLGAKSYNHYLAQGWDDYHADNKSDPNSMTHGQTNPWKESVEAEELIAQAELTEGLPRAAVKLLSKSDSIDKSPEGSHPWKQAVSYILTNDSKGLAAHLKGTGRPIATHIMQALHQYGGPEGKSMAKHLGWMGEETDLSEWNVGDIVKPTVGPHAHAPHTIIHKHEDGSFNIRPNLPPKIVKYKLGAVKARPEQLTKYHTEEVEKVEPSLEPLQTLEERRLTDEQKATRERIVKGMKKHLGDFQKRYGKKAKSVMYASATKQAMGEANTPEQHQAAIAKKTAKMNPAMRGVMGGVDVMTPALAKKLSDQMAVTRAGSDAAKGSKNMKAALDKATVKKEQTTYQSYDIVLDEVSKEVLIPLESVSEFEVFMETVETSDDVQQLVARMGGSIS